VAAESHVNASLKSLQKLEPMSQRLNLADGQQVLGGRCDAELRESAQ